MKVAVVHYWLYAMRGGEKVLEEIFKIFPQADLYTNLFLPENISDIIKDRPVKTTFIHHLPLAKKLYQAYLPLMPWALKRLNLEEYDLIISSESGPAKGVVKPPGAFHICYCHSPMRYIWDMREVYLEQASWSEKIFLNAITPAMRSWDLRSSHEVDFFITNSNHVRKRVKRIYHREAEVIYPPVDVDFFRVRQKKGDFFLLAGQLVPYKRPDLAIHAFNQLDLPLKVVGVGPLEKRLKHLANRNINFLNSVDRENLKQLLATCRALIFPGEEDFGILPVEAQAAGTPVIAYGKGGVLETVTGLNPEENPQKDINYTGLFFQEPTPESLMNSIKRFLELEDIFTPEACQTTAQQFSAEIFRLKFQAFLNRHLPT